MVVLLLVSPSEIPFRLVSVYLSSKLTIVVAFVYPTTEGPLYHKGHSIILGLLCYAWVAALANVLYCIKVNRDKRNGKYAKFEGTGDDRDPSFVMVL